MTEPTNADRAAWAAIVVKVFTDLVRNEGEPAETCVSDLLADLMHYADREDFDFDAALTTARMNHEAEVEEDQA